MKEKKYEPFVSIKIILQSEAIIIQSVHVILPVALFGRILWNITSIKGFKDVNEVITKLAIACVLRHWV